MIEKLSTLQPYEGINICILLGALVLYVLIWITGAGSQLFSRKQLPRIPRFDSSLFPHPAEELYTMLFMVFYTYISLMNVTTDKAAPGSASATDAWLSAFISLAIYTPMALRYFALPATKGAITKNNFVCMIATLGTIYLISITLSMTGFLNWLSSVTGSPEQQQVTEEIAGAKSLLTLSGLIFNAVIVAPLMEEIAFRGFMYNVLRQRAGIIAAAISSSLFFSAVHTSLIQTVVLFVFGCAQCYLYEKTRTLIFPIILHAIFNSVSIIFILLIG
ncbi:MAG: CPBP family intramembrane metalloprotease [Akkermansia sp.]|nr:CPBP family intramembrane metalloprotease [Akkermansia sp.]